MRCCEHDLHLRCFPHYSCALGLCFVRMTNGSPLTVCCCAVLQVAKAVSHSLNNCVNCLPGQKDVDMALRSIGEASKKLLVDAVSPAARGKHWGFYWPVSCTFHYEVLIEETLLLLTQNHPCITDHPPVFHTYFTYTSMFHDQPRTKLVMAFDNDVLSANYSAA